ncbi:MAG: PqiC family protein [Nitrospinota bacterium]
MKRSLLKLIALSFLTFLFSGCPGVSYTDPIRYYLIDPVDYPNAFRGEEKPLSLEIISLHIPQYLERFHIATRTSQSQLEFSESHQWGENLRKNLLRTMSRNLSALLKTFDIGTPLNRSASLPNYRVQVHIEQFELESNRKVKLVARWQLSKGTQSKPLGVFHAELQGEEIERMSYEKMVSVMRQLYGELCEQIANSILKNKS